MPIPAALHEWKSWADRLGTAALYYRQDFEDKAASMADDEALINEFGTFYARAASGDDLTSLNAWLSQTRGQLPIDPDERAVRNLILFFGHLGRRRWKPFSAYLIRDEGVVPPTPDWSKLPAEMRFLAEPAERCRQKYSYLFSEEVRDQIAAHTPAEERAYYAPVADQVRLAGYQRINDWRKRHGVREHIEAGMVFDLLALLDALGLPYYDA